VNISIEELISNHKSIGIASYDAGGANIINSMIKHFSNHIFLSHTDGPALDIFNADNTQREKSEIAFFKKIDLLILGTGGTDFEKSLLQKAVKKNITTISILDHFVNFSDRFLLKNEITYPHYCFVVDEPALQIAKKELKPYKNIYLCKNYYIEFMKNELNNNIKIDSEKVLYILEDIKEDWGNEPAWYLAFKNFYYNFFKKNPNLKSIIVRPHPKDKLEKYIELTKYEEVIFDTNISQLDSLNVVKKVIGIESYFLYLAKELGFDVYSSIPTNIRSPRLPKNTYKTISPRCP
tara:strand:- start:334 stop:1212 length:879 start_codon:yes stop_codon:yes gene_type:complete